MSKNLLVSVLGNRKSGKSHTWNTLFGKTVRTGGEVRKLYLSDTEYVEVFPWCQQRTNFLLKFWGKRAT